MLSSNHIYKKWGQICLIFVLIQFMNLGNINAQNKDNSGIEQFPVTVYFEKTGAGVFNALYSDRGSIYFPVVEILDYLKITRTSGTDEQRIKGFLLTENNGYDIDYEQHLAIVGNKQYQLSAADFIYDSGQLFMKKEALEKTFEFKIKFDFRSLSANIGADYEFPITRIMKLEKARENLRQIQNTETYDSIIPRQYHIARFGMLDWSGAGNWMFKNTNEVRYGLGLGAELLGGETNLWLNYSDRYGFNRNQQRYYWRWVDNNFSVARQVQVGRVYSKSIASLLSPMDGFVITNAPSAVRKALGDYTISDHTNPEWMVELYINNVLTSYTKADASGFYSFKVPVVYGTSHITLRFYGPNGEERSEEKVLNMPFNFLPKGEFEYRITGGSLLDSTDARYARAEVNYGLVRGITIGGGYEYLSSITNHPDIPFATINIQPFPRLILTGEYAHGVRSKGTLNYNLGSSTLDVDYTRYVRDQTAIIYNYREERVANLSIPFSMKKFSGFTRAGVRQNVFEHFSYTTGELMFSGYFGKFNANLTNYANWTDMGTSNYYSNLTLGFRFWKNSSFRPSAQYNYSQDKFIAYKVEVEKQLFKNAYLSAVYENNIIQKYSSVNIAFRWELSFMSGYLSSYFNKSDPQLAASARGGLGFGSGNNYVYTDSHEMVGRSGVSLMAYIDENFNGKKDPKEHFITKLAVRCNGGKVVYNDTDSITRVVGLEPFIDYVLHLDDSQFENISWKFSKKDIKVRTDPNQFKKIMVSVQPMGEVTGMVIDEESGNGKGRILINIIDKKGNIVAHTQTEGDGYFSYLGLIPGNYNVGIDQAQLKVLDIQSDPVPVTIEENIQGDIKDVGNIFLRHIKTTVLSEVKKSDENRPSAPAIKPVPAVVPVQQKPALQVHRPDSLLKLMVLFDFNKYVLRSEYKGTLERLAQLFKEHDCLKLEIQGHTDSIGGEDYNLKLSEQRANAVIEKLLELGVNKAQMNPRGLGKRFAIASNSTEEGRSKNRHVVFKDVSDFNCINVDSLLSAISTQTSSRIEKAKSEEPIGTLKSEPTGEWPTTKNLYSIFFHKDQYELNVQSHSLLDALTEVLKANPNVSLEVYVHADSEAESLKSKVLSDQRFKSVANYLINSGINSGRIKRLNSDGDVPFGNQPYTSGKSLNSRAIMRFMVSGNEIDLNDDVFKRIKNSDSSDAKQFYIRNINGRYIVQVGAFETEKQAMVIAEKLYKLFPDNTLVEEEGKYFKIRIVYLKTYAAALRVQSYIQATSVLSNN